MESANNALNMNAEGTAKSEMMHEELKETEEDKQSSAQSEKKVPFHH